MRTMNLNSGRMVLGTDRDYAMRFYLDSSADRATCGYEEDEEGRSKKKEERAIDARGLEKPSEQ